MQLDETKCQAIVGGQQCGFEPGHLGGHGIIREIAPLGGPSLNWRPGPARGGEIPEHDCGDKFLVAVNYIDRWKKLRWDIQVIETTETRYEVAGNSWEWGWGDVEWYVPTSELESTLPGESE